MSNVFIDFILFYLKKKKWCGGGGVLLFQHKKGGFERPHQPIFNFKGNTFRVFCTTAAFTHTKPNIYLQSITLPRSKTTKQLACLQRLLQINDSLSVTGVGSRPETGSGSAEDAVGRTGTTVVRRSVTVGGGVEVLNRSKYEFASSPNTLTFKVFVLLSLELTTANDKKR